MENEIKIRNNVLKGMNLYPTNPANQKVVAYRDIKGKVFFFLNSKPVKHIKSHSPTGMNYGYCGSGPSDAALSILKMLLKKKPAAILYQQFKFDFIAALNGNSNLVEFEFNLEEWADKTGLAGYLAPILD
ncbi:hypothetical protein KA977_04030 [Candidatus Dependentiae bacterium]|nr:hypothetical protein [Candidatus Dependentiae bacterium]